MAYVFPIPVQWLSMVTKSRPILIVSLIAVVNAIGYGIIIPILYTYTRKFGMSDFDVGLLVSVFSVCQFLSTPVIGRMSDKYGRKPLLVASLAGTAVSFLLMATAPSALFIFLARALDGLTAGNLPVASAVISDTTAPKDRAKGFGIIGASFGFGFIVGPAMSAFFLRFGDAAPFWLAAGVAAISVILTALYLPETNAHGREVSRGKIFDIPKLVRSAWDPDVGVALISTFVYAITFSMYVFAYQPFAIKVLGMDPVHIALNFTGIGVVGLIAQGFMLPRLVRLVGERVLLLGSLVGVTITFVALYLARSPAVFVGITIIHAFLNAPVAPLIQTLLSKETDEKSQGSVLGLNSSYASVGQIIGPLLGGSIASQSVHGPFLAAGATAAVCLFLAAKMLHHHVRKASAF